MSYTSNCATWVARHAAGDRQPTTVMLTLFKIAVRVKQYKDRVLLHLPSSCPVKALLARSVSDSIRQTGASHAASP
jgi:hypothetical protein